MAEVHLAVPVAAAAPSQQVTTSQCGPINSARAKRPIPWTIVNFSLDVALLGGFLLLVWISCILHFVFPAGAAGFAWKVLGRSLTDWRNFQFLTLLGLGFGLLLHVMFHWSWICGVVRTKLLNRPGRDDTGSDTIWGVAFLVFLLHLLGAGLLAGWISRAPL